MFDRSCSAVTWSYHDALGVFCCVRPHCREGSFCTCLPSIRVVHVLDEHVWLEINALIGISEGNSAKGPQLHVPAQQTGSRALTIYRALHNKQAAGPWQFIALFVDDCGKCEFWVILKDLGSRPDVCSVHLLHPYYHRISRHAFCFSCCCMQNDSSLTFPVWSIWCKLAATGPTRPKLAGPPTGPGGGIYSFEALLC